jgi:hypothetical protein
MHANSAAPECKWVPSAPDTIGMYQSGELKPLFKSAGVSADM